MEHKLGCPEQAGGDCDCPPEITAEAGKRLLDRINEWVEWPMSERSEWLIMEDIAAIKAEAVAAERARIAEGVRRLPGYIVGWGQRIDGCVDRATVLAIIEEKP